MLNDCGYWGSENHVTPVGVAILEDFSLGPCAFIQYGLDINCDVEKTIVAKSKRDCLTVLLKAGIHTVRLSNSSQLAIAAGGAGSEVPENQQEEPLYSLKYMCRTVIRQQLLTSDKRNLFVTATQNHLKLPKALCEYIVCDHTIC